MKRLLLLCVALLACALQAAPRFIGAQRYGVRPGHEILWRIPLVGATEVKALALPEGVTFSPATRTLSGRLAQAGEYPVKLLATDGTEEVTETFTLQVGEVLCLAPPMGWNSWYSTSENVSQAAIEEVGRLLVETGLADVGWCSVNIDDCWQGDRLPDGALQPNDKFPDMARLCDTLHRLGLKAGIYSTPWISTYAGFRGSSLDAEENDLLPEAERLQPGQVYGRYPGLHQRHVDRIGSQWVFDKDAQQWANWGFDFVKVDWHPNDLPTAQRIARDLRATNRDIVLSLSNNASLENAEGLSQIANLWRTTGDIQDTWQSIRTIGRAQLAWLPFRSAGHWPDPDILQIGRLGIPNRQNVTFRPSRLMHTEQHYQMALWCMLSAPLLISSDLAHMDAETKALLTDPDLIELNQRYAAAPLTLQEVTPDFFILRKTLGEAGVAYGLFNDSDAPQILHLSGGAPRALPPHSARIIREKHPSMQKINH